MYSVTAKGLFSGLINMFLRGGFGTSTPMCTTTSALSKTLDKYEKHLN